MFLIGWLAGKTRGENMWNKGHLETKKLKKKISKVVRIAVPIQVFQQVVVSESQALGWRCLRAI